MTNSKAEFYQTRLNELYAIIQKLSPSSSADEFQAFASRFTTDCTVHFKSMRLPPGNNRQEAISEMKEVLEQYQIEDREVLQISLAPDGYTVFCETKQRVNVMGEVVEPWCETQVVTFDDEGLVKSLKTYCCWSPIVAVVQRKTGNGPYSEAYMKVHETKTEADDAISKSLGVDVGKACCA
ncbi:hypothetical protein DM02DRAFT_687938 [Periconia macrospinosa]|uniref:SnoaL-like domain-containing protein n=1 Tax=Periconia macrospinosa TaxID=97972 RepID=A0A2V1DFD6_9PLEO|nr:hypothetical protein DM02DRAFT_687938 [Periconia macrospinosa]